MLRHMHWIVAFVCLLLHEHCSIYVLPRSISAFLHLHQILNHTSTPKHQSMFWWYEVFLTKKNLKRTHFFPFPLITPITTTITMYFILIAKAYWEIPLERGMMWGRGWGGWWFKVEGRRGLGGRAFAHQSTGNFTHHNHCPKNLSSVKIWTESFLKGKWVSK